MQVQDTSHHILYPSIHRHECENGHCTGHLEKYQDPDALDRREVRGETAVHKAARNDDVNKLELLDLACANLNLQVSWLRGLRGAQRPASHCFKNGCQRSTSQPQSGS